MSETPSACPECGAKLDPGAHQCELCGYSLERSVEQEGVVEGTPSAASATATPTSVFCNQCGWRNPVGARFCSACGSPLQELSPKAPVVLPPQPEPARSGRAEAPPGMGRSIGIVIGAAVLLVVGLYVVTLVSKGNTAPAASSQTAQQAAPAAPAFAPLSAEVEGQVETLRREIAAASGDGKRSKQRELVNLLIGVGRPDLASETQAEIAGEENTPEAWVRTGDLLMGWMESLPEADRGTLAPRVIEAFDRALALDPDHLDARERLAWAAQYDGTDPMRAINETNEVLRRDSLHLGANFNMGWFLMRIGRTDQAIERMKKVERLAGPESPMGQQAGAVVRALQEQAASQPAPGSTP